MFLIFAFEGDVTSQVSALKDTSSPKVFYIAAATLVSVSPVFLKTKDRVSRRCTVLCVEGSLSTLSHAVCLEGEAPVVESFAARRFVSTDRSRANPADLLECFLNTCPCYSYRLQVLYPALMLTMTARTYR